MVVILFVMAFVVGPGLFFLLDRVAERHWPLAFVASLLVLASFVLRSDAYLTFPVDATRVFLSVTLIWLGWVVVMVLAARALRQAVSTPRARRLVRAAGAMGTTVPWFGFAAAQMMAR
ncbi:hypothetical protein [Tateyamaria omphalii]|uniref:Uncharacterized protein n=1 Tax=Tateyamaria omphalii TaxID=299262 RepID=A0A1P8MXZ3_9RHOB|nr:hypothetical protein [Tateyamaria omphalii]APX12878.1 hypothetical protein BWR18_15175 [Tateyamaria omphalii]